VPVQDWLDRAAAALTNAADSSVVLTILAMLESDGRVRSCEAVGAAAASQAGQSVLEPLRARAGRLQGFNLGGWQTSDTAPFVTRMSEVIPDWRTGPLGRVWPQPHPTELIGAVSRAADGPALLVLMAAPHGSEVPLTVLPVVMPLLADAAAKCLVWATSDSGFLLTIKEQEVLAQLAQGRSVKQIAEMLGRSPHTVHDHVKALHRKLDASSRGELIAKALGHLPSARGTATAAVAPAPDRVHPN
jgi:DNA-binding CsgD family transcriptional regulator